MACLESEQQADIKETGSKVLRSAAEQEHCGTDLEKASWRRLDLPGLEGWHRLGVSKRIIKTSRWRDPPAVSQTCPLPARMRIPGSLAFLFECSVSSTLLPQVSLRRLCP
jgi:hypothetical protein